jgi:uncharacterized membrane protein
VVALKSILAVCVVLLMFVPVGALAQNGPQTQTLASPSHTDLAVSDTIKTMDLRYSFSEPSIYYGLGYGGMTHIMSDLPKVHVPGLPAVPVQTKVIELPGDARVNDVKATVGHRSVAYLPAELEMSPDLVAIGSQGPIAGTEKSLFYEGNRFPADWFAYDLHRGLNSKSQDTVFVDLYLYPAYYEGSVGNGPRLTYVDSIDVTIDYTTVGILSAPRAETYDEIILGPTDFQTYLTDLAAHKTMTGLKAKFVSLDEIYNGVYFTTQGRDPQEKIKYFIKDATESWGIKYVVLGGDVDMFPVRHVQVYDGTDDQGLDYMDGRWVPADGYYGDIYDAAGAFSSWDETNNGVFGEWNGGYMNGMTDDPDLYQDVYVGRLPASNAYDMSLLVNKIKTYENNSDWSWFFNAGLAGVDTWVNDGSGVAESEYGLDQTGAVLAQKNFILHKMYATQGTLSPDAINSAVNGGLGVMAISGHGGFDVWGDETTLYYSNDYMGGMTNGVKLPMGTQSACDTGGFDDESDTYFVYPPGWVGDSMSEEFLLVNGGGYISDVGSARLAYGMYGTGWAGCCSGYFERMYYKAFIDGEGTPGRMLSTGKNTYMADMGIDTVVDYKHVMEYNLMGDPSVAIGGVGLRILPLSSDVVLAPGQSADLNFSVKNIGAWAVSTSDQATSTGPISTVTSPSILNLASGQESVVTVTVTVNFDAVAFTEIPVNLTVRSSLNDRTTSGEAKVKVAQVFGMDLGADADVKTVLPSDHVAFTLNVVNTGNGPDAASLTYTGVPTGWGANLDHPSVDLATFGTTSATLTLDSPAQVLAGSYYLNASATLTGAPITRTKTLRVDVLPKHDVSISCDPCTASVDPGKIVYVPIKLHNNGNVPEDMSVSGTAPEGWTVTPESLSHRVEAYQSNDFAITVAAPAKILAGEYTVTASTSASGAYGEVSLKITVNQVHGLLLTVAAPEYSVDGGQSATFSAVISNTGNGQEQVTIESVSTPQNWIAQGNPQSFTINGYEDATLDIVISTNLLDLAGDYNVTMRANATTFLGLVSNVTVTVNIAERPDAKAQINLLNISALPGKYTTNSVLFSNDGNIKETFDLVFGPSLDLVFTALDKDITAAAFSDVETGFKITVRDNVLAGPHSYNVIVRRNKGPDINLTGTIKVLQFYKLDVVAVKSSYIVETGGTLLKKVTVTNRGNGQDTFTVKLLGDTPGWASMSDTVVTLGPGQSKEITLTITPSKKAAPEMQHLKVDVKSSSGVSGSALVDYRITAKGGTTTTAASMGLLPWVIIALVVGFVVGHAIIKGRKEQYRRPPQGW